MTTRRIRKPISIGGVALLAAAVCAGGSILTSGSAGAARPNAAPKMPDAAISGCDVLLHGARRSPLPAAVAERRVHRAAPSTTTGRRLNISAKLDPTNKQGVHVEHRPRRTRATASRPAR